MTTDLPVPSPVVTAALESIADEETEETEEMPAKIVYDYSGWGLATHAGPHIDELYGSWLLMHEAKLNPRTFLNFPRTEKQMRLLPEQTVLIGIGKDEFDEHDPNGRPEDTSAASLVMNKLGVSGLKPVEHLLLEAVHRADTKGDTCRFGIDALLKVVTVLDPFNHDLHREVANRIWRAFDAITGAEQVLDYKPLPKYDGPDLSQCADVDDLYALWVGIVQATRKHQNMDAAIAKMDKCWEDQTSNSWKEKAPDGKEDTWVPPWMVVHLRNVTHNIMHKFGKEEAYAFMRLFLDAYLEKQLAIIGYGECHDEWARARARTPMFTTASGYKVAMVWTTSPFMLSHLRLRHDLRNPELRPDILIIRTRLPGSPEERTSVWSFSDESKDLLTEVTIRLGRREYKLAEADMSPHVRNAYDAKLRMIGEQRKSVNLPDVASRWYLFMHGKEGETVKSWAFLNGSHTREADPTSLTLPIHWYELLETL